MFFPLSACHKQYAFSKSRTSLWVSLSRAIWSKCLFLLVADVGREDQGRYSRARKVVMKVTTDKFSMVSMWVWLLTLYMHKYWKCTKGKANISTVFLLHVPQNCQANITANLRFLMYRCFLMAVDGRQGFMVEVTVTLGFNILASCRQFTWWQVLSAKHPGPYPKDWHPPLYHINEPVQLKIITNANLVKRSLIGKFHDCTREVVV